MKIKSLLIIVFFTLTTSNLFPQSHDKTLATVGSEKITINEFKTRYELMPHISKYQNPDSIKKEFLYSLIAEKLWAKEAASEGLDTAQIIKLMVEPLNKMYIRDALFEQKIGKKINISKKEIHRGLNRIGTELKMKILASKDSSAIYEAYSQLKKAVSFDSIDIPGIQITGENKPVSITFGQMNNTNVEDSLYSIKVGNFTNPIKTKSGWFIFKLVNKISKVFKDDENGNTVQQVNRIIRERKAKELGTQYLDRLLTGVHVNYNMPLFYTLSDKIYSLFKQKEEKGYINKNDEVDLDEYDAVKIISLLGSDSANMKLIEFKKNPLSLKEFVYDLTLDGFSIKNPSIEKIRADLDKKLKILTRQELITREGIKEGLDKSTYVEEQMNRWEENFTAKLLRDKYADSAKVSDKEAYEYYLNVNNMSNLTTQVNIIEIMSTSLDTMQIILSELKDGKDFRELASKYTQRKWTKDKDGEFGYFPVTMFGEIGRIANTMKIGQIYGPIKVPQGYSIFKLIEKKKAQNVKLKSFDENKEKIKDNLFAKKLKYYFNKYTVKFANKYGIKFDDNLLKSTKVTNINMFTYKYMGFGGQIAAVPYTTPSYDWIKYWRNSSKVLP